MAVELSSITGGEGVNYALDTTGVPAVVTGAAGALSIRGTLAVLAAARPGTKAPIDIDIPSLLKGWTFETIVQGARFRRCSSPGWWSCRPGSQVLPRARMHPRPPSSRSQRST